MDYPEQRPGKERAVAAVTAYGIPVEVTRHGAAKSLEEAAAARGVRPGDIIKSLVVRRGDAAVARDVTGYERGTITPFGSTRAWPVIADTTVAGRTISLGGGAHGVGLTLSGDDVVRVLDAQVADISD